MVRGQLWQSNLPPPILLYQAFQDVITPEMNGTRLDSEIHFDSVEVTSPG